jgi:type I restriction enzyme S subunit
MKKGWTTCRVGDVCKYDKAQGIHRGLPYVGLEHIESNTGRFVGSHSSQPAKSSTFRFSSSHVLYGRLRPYLNKAFAPDFEGHCSTEIFPIKPAPEVSRDYLLYWLLADETMDRINSTCTGARMPRADMNEVLDFDFPLPPLPEQKRIVGVLDEAFAGLAVAKANAEKNLQNARTLFESHLQSVFTKGGEGWVENNLRELATKIGSGATPRGGEESYKSEGISLIRSMNVHDYGFKYRKLAFINDDQADELSNVEVQSRDVLLNITGASVARCCIVPDDVLPARVNQHVSIIRPIADKLDSNFLHYLLISKLYKDQLLQTGAEGGSTRQAITKAQIQDFTIKYPATLKDQKSIAAKLDSLITETQRLARVYEQKQAALEALKQSLLHQAFTGEL